MPDVPRPPFDRLDAMAPPDQWAEVAARLDEAPAPLADGPHDGPARSTPRRWALAAAVAVLLAGATGVVVGRDAPSPTVADGGAAAGCPFTFLPRADELLRPSSGELRLVAGAAPGSDTRGRAVQHAVVEGAVIGDRTIEVDVVASGGEPAPDPALEQVGPTTWLDLHIPVRQPRPGCDLIRVRIDVRQKGDVEVDDLAGDFAHLADFVAEVLALTPLDPELAAGEPCTFALDDLALGPVAPAGPADAAPYDTEPRDLVRDDLVARWQQVEVGGAVALVGVGGSGTGPVVGPVGDRWIDDSPSGNTGAARLIMTGYLSVAPSGWCTDAVVHLLIPLTDEQAAAAEADFDGDWIDLDALRATIGRVMDAVRVTP